jgi:hypothetical protein
MIYAVFGVGIGNLGRSRAPRNPMPEWAEMLNRHLADGTPPVQITGFFGHTGNFLADSPSTNLEKVAARFGRALGTDWAVRPIDDVQTALTALANARRPEAQDGIRWTLGLAFQGRAGIEGGSILTTPQAILWEISPSAIGVWKRDNLGEGGMLDRDRRGGGWGKISDDIESQLGGRWTARSRRTVDGLARKAATAKRHGASQPVTRTRANR